MQIKREKKITISCPTTHIHTAQKSQKQTTIHSLDSLQSLHKSISFYYAEHFSRFIFCQLVFFLCIILQFFSFSFFIIYFYFFFVFLLNHRRLCCGNFSIKTNGIYSKIYAAKKSQESSTTANVGCSKQSTNAIESEFISDAFQTTDKDLDEVKAGMKLLGIDSLTSQSNKNDGKTVCTTP